MGLGEKNCQSTYPHMLLERLIDDTNPRVSAAGVAGVRSLRRSPLRRHRAEHSALRETCARAQSSDVSNRSGMERAYSISDPSFYHAGLMTRALW